MVTAGRHAVRMGDDGWAIFSQDGSLAAHFEFTVAITADGPRVLTPWHEPERAQARAARRRARPPPAQTPDVATICVLPRARRSACAAHVRDVVAAARRGSQSRVAGHHAERDHEGTTVGQADVREVQDHPPPRRGAGDLPEPASQAAAGVASMARIAGINIPLNKRVEVGLTYIYGIGRSTVQQAARTKPASTPTPTCAT